MFDEGGSTEVELPLAYYTFHGRGSGQGGGAAWPSHSEHRRQRSNQRGKNFFLSLSEWVGLTSPSHKIFTKILSNQLNSQDHWRHSIIFNNVKLNKPRSVVRQKADNQRELISKKSRIENNLPEMKYTIQLASDKGASSWLNALPLSKHGFDLTKTEFHDGIALRYTWEAKNTPAICPCGKEFSLTHALHCAKGGYTHLRHNQIRDVFANLMDDVCHDVQIEPKLQSLDGEIFSSNSTTSDDDSRLDIKANGLWGFRFNRTFFDVKIFNPHAKSCPKTIKDAYKYHESIKRNKYEERIRES